MKKTLFGMTAAVALACTANVSAVTVQDTSLNHGYINGSGNINDHFTVDINDGVEVGLRAGIPFGAAIDPAGTNVFHVATGQIWNFYWQVNVNDDEANDNVLSDYTYELAIDTDASQGVNSFTLDPITPSVPLFYFDHALGNNGDVQAPGHPHVTPDSPTYIATLDSTTIAANSWRHGFFPVTYDVDLDGTYDISLSVLDGSGAVVSSSTIQVIAGAGGAPIPEPATMTLLGLGLAGLGVRYRKRKSA